MPSIVLSVVWIMAAAGYFLWEFSTYSGLYRRLAELQVAHFGKYQIYLTALVPFFLVAGPAFAHLGRRDRERRAEAERARDPETVRADRGRRTIRAMLLLAPVLAGLSGASFWLGQRNAVPAGAPPRPIDLATFGEPPAGLVVVSGTVQVDRAVVTTSESRARIEEDVYAPIVPPGAGPAAAPIRVFVKRSTRRGPNERRLTHYFLGTQTGVLVRDGLPASVRTSFRDRGLAIAEPHYVLAPPSARSDVYYIVGGVSGLVALILALGATAASIGHRFRTRGDA